MNFLLKIFKRLPRWLRKIIFVVFSLSSRAMTLGVRILVTNQEDQVLLVKHTYTRGWHLPGGGVERGETMLQAANKELMEECKIENTASLKLFHIYKNPYNSRYDHVALFICKEWRQQGEWKADHEIAELGFFDLADLPKDITFQTRDRLLEVLQQQPVRDIW